MFYFNSIFFLQKIIDYLKFDIEESEWPTLQQMAKSKFIATNVKQLSFEVHMYRDSDDVKSFTERLKILMDLESLGFRKWHFNHNVKSYLYDHDHEVYYPTCAELYYVNINFL